MSAVACQDATDWLDDHHQEGPVVVSLPDAAELKISVPDWIPKYLYWAAMCIRAAKDACVIYATDRKHDGRWESKPKLLMTAAEGARMPLLWHKIVLTQQADTVNLFRPGYMHLMAFGTVRPGKAFPDVLIGGQKLWKNGIATNVADLVIDWLGQVAPDGPILNPFCGYGTFLAAAARTGRECLGCDIELSCVERAQSVMVGLESTRTLF